jgi:hypothetical protein
LQLDEDLQRLVYDKYTIGYNDSLSDILKSRIESTIEKLSGYDVDLIICIPLKTGAPLGPVLDNLASLELPTKTGVIVALDELSTIPTEWLDQLKARLEQLKRYVFTTPFYTTNIPLELLPNQEWVNFLKGRHKLVLNYLEKHGMRNPPTPLHSFFIFREDTRILCKHLNFKYLLWLDADVKPPRDALKRLMNLIETKADLACGWYMDRHRVNGDADLYLLEEPNSPKHMVLRRTKTPIAIKMTGFGCVLMKKELNDKISFFRPELGTEDFKYCLNCHDMGYRLFVDPTCFCEHG